MARLAIRKDRVNRTVMDNGTAGFVFTRTETNAAVGVAIAIPVTRTVWITAAIAGARSLMAFFVVGNPGCRRRQGSSGFGSGFGDGRCDRACGGRTDSFDRLDGNNRRPRALGSRSVPDDANGESRQFRSGNVLQFTLQPLSRFFFCVRVGEERARAEDSSNSCNSSHTNQFLAFRAGLAEHGFCQSCSWRTLIERLGTQRLNPESRTDGSKSNWGWGELSPKAGD
jgi:hypothetical protein